MGHPHLKMKVETLYIATFAIVTMMVMTLAVACKTNSGNSSLMDMSDTGQNDPPSQTSPDSARWYKSRLEASMMQTSEINAFVQTGLVIEMEGLHSGTTYKYQYDVGFEATLRVILAGKVEGDSVLNNRGEFNFPVSTWRVFVGECQIKPRIKNSHSVDAELLFYGNGGGVSTLDSVEHSVERVENFYIRDGDTVEKIKSQCLTSLKDSEAENLKKQLADWIKATYKAGKKGGVNLYNNTGLSLHVIAPDGSESWVGTRTQYSYPEKFLSKQFKVWYQDTCYKWTPSELDKGYWVELLTWGLRGCKASQGCVDVTNDDGAPPVGYGSKC